MSAKSPTPLSNAQVEILKAFSVNLNEDDLQDFKRNIAQFMLEKIRTIADKEWKEKGYNDDTIKGWLNED